MDGVHVLAFEEAGFGGAFIDLKHIAMELLSRGARVTIARTDDGAYWQPLREAGATLLRHPRLEIAHALHQRDLLGRHTRRAIYLGELLAQHTPNGLRYAVYGRRHGVTHVLANNSVVVNPASVVTAGALGVPLVSYYQGILDGTNGLRYLLPRVDKAFAVSQFIFDNVAKLGGDPTIMDVLYPGIERPPEALSAPRPDDGTVRIGMVGMFTPWKGQMAFLRAFREVAARVPGAEAWLFGQAAAGQEGYTAEITQAIAEVDFGGRVQVVSDRTQPGTIYPEVDLCVHCSLLPEPFGRVVIEAMGFGRPVVAGHVGGPGEAVEDGVTGLRADPSDHHDLAARIIELASNRERRLEMGRRAREAVLERFTYPRVLQPLLDYLERPIS